MKDRPDEPHLRGVTQLTFGGENAEAYFSPDGRTLIYQRTPAEGGCDQQFTYNLDTGEQSLIRPAPHAATRPTT